MSAARPPVLLVPGFSGQDIIYWNVMHNRFERDGFQTFTTTFPRLTMQDMRRSAALVGDRIEEILAVTGHDRLHVMGHSMGGLILRYYVERLGGDRRVASMVTVGTPHQGTYIALAALPVEAGRQLLPGSDFLKELNGGHPDVPLLNIYGTMDMIVLPPTNAILKGAHNERVRVSGHWSLLVRHAVYRKARAWFESHEGAVWDQGDGLGAGVT